MAIRSRNREDRAAREIAAFLSEHEECGGGFRINPAERSAGDPFRIDCRGCGESLTRRGAAAPTGAVAMAATIANSAEDEDDPPGEEPEVAGENAQGALSVPRFQAPSFTVPPWLGDALIWTAILTVAGTLAVGIIRHVDDGQTGGTPSLPAPVVQEQPPSPPVPAAAKPASQDATALRVPVARFDRHTEVAGLSIGVPSGWGPAAGGGAVGMIALDGTAMLRVFASPGPPPKHFAGGASRFLRQEHPGAKVAEPRPVRIGGLRATLVRAAYPGGIERALVFTSAGTAYLVTARTNGSAGPRTRSQARRLLRSVRAG
jgi:hypothetical protein